VQSSIETWRDEGARFLLGITVTAWPFKGELVTVERMNDWVGPKG